MKNEDINKIAEAIAAKLAEPGGDKLLGCGDASSSQHYDCETYSCSGYYECGGQAQFDCLSDFRCHDDYHCVNDGHTCLGTFDCSASYSNE